MILINLSVLYRLEARYAEAEPLLIKALAIREKILGPDHPDVAVGLYDLATVYFAQNRLAEAEPLLDRAVEISDRVGTSPQARCKVYLLRARVGWKFDERTAAQR